MNCVRVVSYTHLLGSCANMLLSTCAYILTHTVTSETRRERGSSGRERQRDGQITERRQKDEPLTSQSHPNRTGSAVEREAVPSEVEHARDNEEEVPTTQVTNEAAIVRNGTIDDVANTTTKVNLKHNHLDTNYGVVVYIWCLSTCMCCLIHAGIL